MKRQSAALKTASVIALIMAAAPAWAQQAESQSTDVTSENEIVVTGQRASLGAAARIKQESANVVDSIVAADIGKFPDRTVAGALQRVPGVQVVVGNNNEIVNPIIRGLGDILTTLDGREIFTGVGRGFSYQDLPAEALAGADVYKTSSAQLIEGGVVGVINLRLHKPFDFQGFTIAANARGIYSENTGKISPIVGALVSDRWDTGAGEIGALANVSYSDTDFNRPIAFNCDFRSGNRGPNPVPGGSGGLAAPTCLGGLNNEGNYRRFQTNAAVQWRPSPEILVDLNGLYTQYRSKWASTFLIDDIFGGPFSNVQATQDCQQYDVRGDGFYGNPLNANGTPNPAVTRQTLCTARSFTAGSHGGFTSTQAHNDRTDIYLVAGGLTYDRDALLLKGDLSYQHSLIRNQNFILDILKSGGGMVTTVTNLNQDGGVVYSSPGLSDPTNFALSPLNQDNIRDTGNEFAAKVDGTYRVGSILKELQFGVRYADHKARHQQFLGGNNNAGGRLISGVSFLPSNFLIHSAGIPTVNNGLGVIVANQDVLRDPAIEDQLRSLYGMSAGWPAFQPERTYDAAEKATSAYLQAAYDFPLGGALSIDGLLGLRYTHTNRDIAGAAFVTPAATPANPNPAPVLTPFSATTSDNDFMPNASARIRLGGGLQARLSYAKAIARPSFGSLNPGLSYLISTNILILPSGSGGNPDLRPQKSNSYDATLEYYFGRDSYVSIAGYYKDITDRVITQSQVERINGFDYNISRPRNVGKVTLKGVEISGQAFLDFLPGALSGLGVMANFTLADSEIVRHVDARLIGKPIQGVSRYNYNLGLLYEKFGVTARAVYNHRSGYYDEIYGGTTLRPVNGPPVAGANVLVLNGVRPGGRLDASVGFDITHAITLSVDATNITKNHYRSYYGRPEFPRDHRFDDRSFSVGISGKF